MAGRSSQAADWASLFREWRGGLTQSEFCRRWDAQIREACPNVLTRNLMSLAG